MEQTNTAKQPKNVAKKSDSSAIRFDKTFMRQVTRLVERANKKPFGRKVKPKNIITLLMSMVDETLLDKVIRQAQEESLTHKDKKLQFAKEIQSKVGGSLEQIEQEMMEMYRKLKLQEQA